MTDFDFSQVLEQVDGSPPRLLPALGRG